MRGDAVDGDAQRSPPGHNNGEHAEPDGDARDCDEGGCGDGAHYVGPHARGVQQFHEETEPFLG